MEFADIALDNFVVFAGNNNSGKTMVMQLIYGLRKELRNFLVPVTGVKQTDMNGQYLIRCDQEWFQKVELEINKFLEQDKERIIDNIFGVPICLYNNCNPERDAGKKSCPISWSVFPHKIILQTVCDTSLTTPSS